ncbi:hypothetical protein [Nocardia ignorata]|uniref:Uncharacterized protein n=1 Tax=Nocardia ignorata TaxID=145285 RepID=A0A4R6P2U7_NOCIG|nr:hypothetical protein [Nocardia ignorata]TDP31841.1 hypothetical protein DFR75_10766 [Nocardia ignorata]
MSTFEQRRTRHALRAGLVGTAGFVALSAFVGAVGLAGGAADLGDEITARLPFNSPVLAGLLLAAIIGAPTAATTVLALRADPIDSMVGVCSGAVLMGWGMVQPFVIGRFCWWQPIFGLLGMTVCLLAYLLRRA